MSPQPPITGRELEDMKQRCEKATPAPWIQQDDYPRAIWIKNPESIRTPHGWEDGFYIVPPDDFDKVKIENTEFIAHAREDLPRCLAEIERLQSVLKTIREAGQNDDRTAQWMQRWAAWSMEPTKWPEPTHSPSDFIYPKLFSSPPQ